MKKITILFVALLGLSLFSCSDDDDQSSGGGELKISGQVMSPNGQFPISRALVKVFKGNSVIAQKTTDALGNFTVDDLPAGDVTVELSKGKFKRTLQIDLQSDYQLSTSERNFDTFPNIAVVQGSFDSIEEILFNIGVVDDQGAPAFDIINGVSGRMATDNRHGHGQMARSSSLQPNVTFSVTELLMSTEMLAGYDVIFFNCGGNDNATNSAEAMGNLAAFIHNGGIVYATDWSYTYLRSMFGTEYLTFAQPEKGGNSTQATATLGSADLEAWLEAQGITVTPTVSVEGFLPAWQMVDTFNPATVDDWVITTSVNYGATTHNDKALAFTFPHGCGGVFYSSFHTHGNNSAAAAIDQMMSYFVFELSGLGCGSGS